MGGIRITILKFNVPSTGNLLKGSWTPFKPEFHPFMEVDEFTNPCYRWRFLSLIRGSFPRWGRLLKNPNNPSEDFSRYLSVSDRFRRYCITLIKKISRSNHPSSIINSIGNSGLLLDSIRGTSEVDELDTYTMNLVSQLLIRLFNQGILQNYIEKDDIFFNLRILNEKFNIYQNNSQLISLSPITRTVLGASTPISRSTFTWKGPIAIDGIIPMIDLERKEIKSFIPIAENFFNPQLNLSNSNAPEGMHLLFIEREFHKLWILRKSLSQLIDDQILQSNLQDSLGNDIFSINNNILKSDIKNFDITIETIDHTFSMNSNKDFTKETGQAAIVSNLLYKNYPGIANSFQDCPIRIGQSSPLIYQCPIGSNMGCGMSDKRIRTQNFPRDRCEINIYKFLRYLRDELVFNHELLYKITRLYPSRLFDLNQYCKFWIGEIFHDSAQRLLFQQTTPAHWSLPEISEKKYEISLLSPLVYEKGYQVKIKAQLGNCFELSPIYNFDSWNEDKPFNIANQSNPIPCFLGKFSLNDIIINIQRQKRKLVNPIQYLSSSLSSTTVQDQENEILLRRLNQRDKRIGMATFGRSARFV